MTSPNIIPITRKITGWSVVDKKNPVPVVRQTINEKIKRPDVLEGFTYKLKSPLTKDSSLYITINHILLNEGTEHEQLWPWEIFLNGKDPNSYQWVVALMLITSAVFRKGGDIKFIVDELKSVFDPNGGYISRNGYVPSLVSEIGSIIELDFKKIGLLHDDVEHRQTLQKKKQEYVSAGGSMDNATVCPVCKVKAVINQGGCPTCLQCGDSKCG
jgi:hypothetical protein